MFFFVYFSVFGISTDFCYRTLQNYVECPPNSEKITSIEDLRDFISENDTEIFLYLYNSKESPFIADNDFQANLPITIIGCESSYLSLDITSSLTSQPRITVVNTTIAVSTSQMIPSFSYLSLSNVQFDVIDTLKMKVSTLTSDIQSIQPFNEIVVETADLSFSRYFDPRQYTVNLKVSGEKPSIRFTDLTTDSTLHFNEGQISFKFQSQLKQFIIITTNDNESIDKLTLYMNVDGINLNVESDSLLEHVGFEPYLVNDGTIYFGENTYFLSDGQILHVESGTIYFKDESYLYDVFLQNNHESTFVFNNSLSFKSLTIDNHELHLENNQDSILSISTIKSFSTSQISAENDLIVTGSQIVFNQDSSIRTSHVTLSGFNDLDVSSSTNKVGSLSLDNANISIPISFSKSGLLNVDDITQSNKLRIILTHLYEPGETADMWDKIVNKDITILKTTQASSSLSCDNIEVTILQTSGTDPWMNELLFTKEKFLYTTTCSSNQISIKLLENPKNIYKKFIYADEYRSYQQNLEVINSSSSWSSKVTKYTQGIQIYLHNDMPSVFDISEYSDFNNSIKLKFMQSPYQGYKQLPTLQMMASSLSKEKVISLTIDNVIMQLTSTSGVPDINTQQLNVLGDSSIRQPFTVSAEKVCVQDKLVNSFPVQSGMQLFVVPTDQDFHVVFGNNGWMIKSESINNVSISSNIELNIYSDSTARAYMEIGDDTTNPLTLSLYLYSDKFTVFFDSKFEQMKNMPPILLIGKDSSTVQISTNSSYVPIQFKSLSNIQFGRSLYSETPLALTLPDQRQFDVGTSLSLSVNDEQRFSSIKFSSFRITDTTANDGTTKIASHQKITFTDLRSMLSDKIELDNVNAETFTIDGTTKTIIKDSPIKHLRIQGQLSQVDFPQVELTNLPTEFEDIYVDIEQPSAESVTSFTRVLITSDNSSIDFASLKSKITLSQSIIKIADKNMYISTGISSNSVYMFLSAAPSTDTPTPTFTNSPTASEASSGTTTTIIVASIIIAVVIICVVVILILYRKAPLPIIDSDYLTVSNDYMLKDAVAV